MAPLSALAAAIFLCASPGVTDGDTIRCQDGTSAWSWFSASKRKTRRAPFAARYEPV